MKRFKFLLCVLASMFILSGTTTAGATVVGGDSGGYLMVGQPCGTLGMYGICMDRLGRTMPCQCIRTLWCGVWVNAWMPTNAA